ncbi:peptidylprolyl isomerase, partial [Bacteroidales bacterium OttesenSCG-928-C03]|nr:peptidylprolyl isomerase [Bacteroidales bacterium OttesenSCG-928-C03]
MKKLFSVLLLAFFVCSSTFLNAQYQENALLLKIGDDVITLGEFLNSYQKNNNLADAKNEDLEEYLDLYINFLLKVKEGKTLQIDTAKAFAMELEAYKNQSAQQYLIDKDVSDKIVDEAIERMRYNIRASHILIECDPGASPADTAKAYNKALDIRKKIVNKEYTFNDAAIKYSEDRSVRDIIDPSTGRKQYGNKGDLGYFSAFNLIYPFETAAYNTPVGEISMPVRTQFGYHLIYVQDRIPGVALITVSQIFIADELGAEGKMSAATEEKLKAIERKLREGAAFGQLVQEYSEDEASKENNGQLQPFPPNRRTGDFVKTALNLKPGEISKPVSSTLGW